MYDLQAVWAFTRNRLNTALEELTPQQAEWRLHANAHNILEILYHIAGAEHYWYARLVQGGRIEDPFLQRLDRCVMDGFLNDQLFPFRAEEMSLSHARATLNQTYELIVQVFDQMEQIKGIELTSPIGDQVTGHEGMIRLSQHAAYHTGQIWVFKLHPDFPIPD